MASRTNRFPILVAGAALASHLPSTGHAETTHAEGRSEYRAPRAAVIPSIDGVADEAAWLGIGLPDDNLHAPNEKLVLDNFYRGIHAAAYLMEELGASDASPAAAPAARKAAPRRRS